MRKRQSAVGCTVGTFVYLILGPSMAHLAYSDAGPWRTYEIYQPRVERHYVVRTQDQALKYNHCSTIAWFKGRWICLWNANTVPIESRPNQLIYMSTSSDAKTWSKPELAFASDRRSVNPIPCKLAQWQPSLIVVGGELWCFWSQLTFKHGKKDENYGCWFSKLTDPDGKWKNRRILFEGGPDPVIDGKSFRILPMQNPIRLSTGRFLAPIVMIGPEADDAPKDKNVRKKIWPAEKRDSVLYSDDLGKTWRISPGTVQPGRSWANWEPTVWEEPDGPVGMCARNNDSRGESEGGPRWTELLVWSESKDGGATWTPHEYCPIETVVSRMHVIRSSGDLDGRPAANNRYIMVHNDAHVNVPFSVRDRNTLALFFKRGKGFDFVAGTPLTGRETVVSYPHAWIKDKELYCSYTQGVGYSSIKVAHVSPLPDPKRYYLFPRGRPYPDSPLPERVGDAYHFHAHQYIATRRVVDPGANGFSAGAWVRPEIEGVLLDNRLPGSRGGFVWMIVGGRSSVYLCGAGEVTASRQPRLDFWHWNYVGLTVDLLKGEVVFYLNDEEGERRAFQAENLLPLKGTTGYIGLKRSAGSALRGLVGDIRFLTVYPSVLLGPEDHRWLRNRLAPALGQPEQSGAMQPESKPCVWFDPADEAGFGRDFILPKGNRGGTVEAATIDDLPVLRFHGESAAGVDLDENERDEGDAVRLVFRFRLEEGREHVLCTIGDGNEPARLLARDGRLFLAAANQEVPCGKLKPGEWNDVEVATAGDTTGASLNGRETAVVRRRPKATWIYLGQGFRTGGISPESRFVIDVGSVRTRVEKAAR